MEKVYHQLCPRCVKVITSTARRHYWTCHGCLNQFFWSCTNLAISQKDTDFLLGLDDSDQGFVARGEIAEMYKISVYLVDEIILRGLEKVRDYETGEHNYV